MNECLVRAISIVVLAAVLPGWAVSTCLAEAGTPRPAASADNHRPSLEARLAEAEAVLSERGAVLDRQLEEAQQRLRELEDAGEQAGPEREARKDLLDRRLAVIDGERALLQAAVIARREALEHWEAGDHAAQESTEFRARLAQGPISMGPAELAALEAELAQIASSVAQADQAITAASQRLETLAAPADSPDRSPTEQSLMEAERLAVLAQADAAAQHRLALQTQRELLEARLESARAVPPVTQPAAAATAADRIEAENKRRLAELLEREARGELNEAQTRLETAREKMAVALQTGADRIEIGKLEDDREYWQRKLRYEKRRQQQDDLAQRAADEKRELMRLQERIEAVEATMSQLERTRRSLTDEMRQERAEAFRASAEAAREQAEKHEARAEAARPGIDPWLTLLQSMQPLQEALWERVLKEYNTFHFQRMQTLLDRERQQVNALLNTAEVIVFSIMRQATLERRLANLYVQCADVLVPPAPSFRERHAQLINAGKILLVAVGLSYVVKLLIVLAQRLAGLVGDAVGRGRFSVKRVATLLSFMSSILRLFVWVFAIVGVLNEYGIDPVKSTGAIGLVGLILVGMFQQIVIDFVKGLDIVTGRHYNVGDYVELDGKTGHVIDFSVKHTRIRTASGQEYNLPNSRCIPSRRFPDGYVDNYVDIPLKSSADAQRARRAIAPVCRHLSRRIEQVKEQPEFVERFSGNRPNSLVLRYRVRVLPSCDWIITDRFLPDVKAALAAEEIELADAPTFFFINRIQTFRQLFSRELSEEEILREAKELERPTIERAPAEMPATAAEHAPGAPTPA